MQRKQQSQKCGKVVANRVKEQENGYMQERRVQNTVKALAREAAPSGPILFRLMSSVWSVWLSCKPKHQNTQKNTVLRQVTGIKHQETGKINAQDSAAVRGEGGD